MTTRTIQPDKPVYQREGKRFAQVDLNGMADQVAKQFRARESQAGMSPTAYDSVREIMRAFISSMNGLLVDSDYAILQDRKLQRMMRRDPDVMSPLFQRLYSVAELDWTITPPDQDNELEMKRAAHLKQLIQHSMRRQTEFFKQLADACFYGPSAVNIIYDRVVVPLGRGIAPVAWKPFHSDSLEFNEFGELGMKVSHAFTGDKIPGQRGFVHMFTPEERQAIILHVWNPEGPDYDEPREAGYLYAGRGLRDMCWNFWYMKQTALKLWMIWTQRYAMGNRIFRYPQGNAEGKAAMEKAARNLGNDTSVIVPTDEDNPDAWDIKILEPDAGRAQIMSDLIEGYLAGQIKEMIIGQTATTESTASGLGSSIGDQHAETYHRIIKFDSRVLADSITWEMIIPLYIMNFGESDSYPRFEFPIEKVDSEKWMTGVSQYLDHGGTVSEKQVRERLGIDEPEDDEPVLMGAPGGGQDEFGGRFGGGGLDFARTMRRRDTYKRALNGSK